MLLWKHDVVPPYRCAAFVNNMAGDLVMPPLPIPDHGGQEDIQTWLRRLDWDLARLGRSEVKSCLTAAEAYLRSFDAIPTGLGYHAHLLLRFLRDLLADLGCTTW